MTAVAELARVNGELAGCPPDLTTRQRVEASMGPADGDDAAYWAELAEFIDWARWVGPSRVDGYGDLAELPGWGARVRAMSRALDDLDDAKPAPADWREA